VDSMSDGNRRHDTHCQNRPELGTSAHLENQESPDWLNQHFGVRPHGKVARGRKLGHLGESAISSAHQNINDFQEPVVRTALVGAIERKLIEGLHDFIGTEEGHSALYSFVRKWATQVSGKRASPERRLASMVTDLAVDSAPRKSDMVANEQAFHRDQEMLLTKHINMFVAYAAGRFLAANDSFDGLVRVLKDHGICEPMLIERVEETSFTSYSGANEIVTPFLED